MRIYAPNVAADPPDGLVIDTTGADHLHGNETLMLTGIVNRLNAMGFAARVAIADTWGSAHALARFSSREALVVPPGESGKAFLNLPIIALRLEPKTVSGLRVLGFERIGELAAMPRAPLTMRFGPEVGRGLDQAFGRMGEPIDPIRVADLVEVRGVFAEPISAAQTIVRYTGKLVIQLCKALEEKGSVFAALISCFTGSIAEHKRSGRERRSRSATSSV